MQIDEYLKIKQPTIYKTFVHALKENKLSHAYLINGQNGMPIKQVAFYLAKSILCDSPNPLACLNCNTCNRIEKNEYTDIIFYDGETSNITKKNIDHITETFNKTAVEKKGIVIYILHLVENAEVKAMNTLLKFLEEPSNNVYAFLTTRNEKKLLDTIVSRCQKLTLKITPRNEIININKNEGIPLDDLELLSYLYIDSNEIKAKCQDQKYSQIKDLLFKLISELPKKNNALLIYETIGTSLIKNKEDARFLFDLISAFLEDVIRYNNQENIFLKSYDKIILDLSLKLKHIDKIFLTLMELRNQISLNVNITSLFEHFIIYISEVSNE